MKKEIIVFEEKGEVFTNSLIVANDFEKRHEHVVAKIQEIIPSLQNCDPYFRVAKIKQKRGAGANGYNLTRDGFSLLVMGFTGKKALDWKLKFLKAFNLMEAEIRALREVKAFNKNDIKTLIAREGGKGERKDLTDAVQRLDEYFKESGSESGKFMYANITKLIYKELFDISLSLKRLREIRDYLDAKQLRKLSRVEMLIAEIIDNKIDASLFYRDIYPEIKEAIKNIVNMVGTSKIPILKTENGNLKVTKKLERQYALHID